MFIRGLSGGSVVNNSPENLGDTGLIPDPGGATGVGATKPLHHMGPTTLEAQEPSGPCSTTREAATRRSPHPASREQPLLATTREKALAAVKIWHSQK